uniref:Uncharacterized protein n=1 Tax=Arundo donax TaxID=35708 RepID=A0A0A8ZYQ3_ARUDO
MKGINKFLATKEATFAITHQTISQKY